MKLRTSFLKRCLALVMALVLLVSGSNLGVALTVFAGSASASITEGALIANNYDLSDAEKALLMSNLLPVSEYIYSLPGEEDDLIEVDTEAKTISVKGYNSWQITSAKIVVGEEVKEEVTLTEDEGVYKGTYTYAGNAFSVKVDYALYFNIAEETQNTLLNTGAWLKADIANADAVSGLSGQLYVLEQAMPELVKLANEGIDVNGMEVTLNDEGIAAINRLDAQMKANGSVLLLSKMIETYGESSKTKYVLTEGTDMREEAELLKSDTGAIGTAMKTLVDSLELLIQLGYVNQETANQLKTLSNTVSTLNTELTAVTGAEWTAAEKGTDLVSAMMDDEKYLALDALVAALGEATAVTVKNPLHAADATVSYNLAMHNVTVNVALNVVKDNEIVVYDTNSTTVTLAEGATPEEIYAAVEATGIKADSLTEWADVYVAEHFEYSESQLPTEGLLKDLEFNITYSPKYYTVTINGEAAEYPYGYELTLPNHADPEKSYDYTDSNGKYYPQGSVITIAGDLTLTRDEGKSYTNGKLLSIIVDNYASAEALKKVAAILNSGALNIDEAVDYREPTKAELEELVKLEGSTLTVGSYPSSYKGLDWAPYSYVVDGAEHLFNGATTVTLGGDFDKVDVYYRLTLSNYSKADVKEIFDLVKTLVDEADGQTSVLDRLAAKEADMEGINKNLMTGLSAVIGNYTTANGGGLHTDPVRNDELVAEFQQIIGEIANNCFQGQTLKLYNIVKAYNDPNNGGLIYYYQNHETVRSELDFLSSRLNAMLDKGEKQAALEKLMNENGYGSYASYLETLGDTLAEASENLKPVNAAINTDDAAKLSALATALTMEGSVEVTTYDSPYLQMGPISRASEKFVMVQVKVTAAGKTNTTPIDITIPKDTALTQAQVNDLKAKVIAFVNTTLGEDIEFYNNDYASGASLDALVGVALNQNVELEFTWTAKTYTVKIAGEADQTISIENLIVTLPEHPQAGNGMSYEYTIDGKTASAGIYTFTKEQLRSLFVNGSYTITRVEKNAAVEDLENMEAAVPGLELVGKDGVYTGIKADIAMTELMPFMMGMVMNPSYGYIGLNGEPLVSTNAEGGLEISLQTLINAMLFDDNFTQNTVVNLANNGKGNLFTATMQLGESAEKLTYTAMPFTMNLDSVPEQLTANAGLIKTVTNYIQFKGNSETGKLEITVNLPDKVYGAYAAALIATGNVDKTDVNGLKQSVAIQFVYDYLTAITGSKADLVSFTNTMKMLGLSQDLTGYNGYYDSAVNAFNSEAVTIVISDDGAAVDLKAPGKQTISALLNLTGMGATETMLSMIKEYKAGTIDVSMIGSLANTEKTYYALIVDAEAAGVSNKFEAPSTVKALQEQTKTLAGYSVVMLLDDVDGDLTIGGTTVLDLNGKSVDGTINATGTLYIIDSSMDTYAAGSVNKVKGNATIIAGNYGSDVSAFLKDGYYMDGTTVRNTLYHITDEDNTVTFVLDANIDDNGIPNYKALAIDIAADLVLNYAYSAMLSVEGKEIVGIDVDDLVGIYDDRDAAGLAKQLIDCVTIGEAGYENNEGFEAVVNMILADIIDFGAISEALANDTALATYAITTAPWTVELQHITDGDYMTVNVGSNADLAKDFDVALVVDSKYNDTLAALTGELAQIVEDRTELLVDIPTPTYSDKTLTVTGAGKANVYVDMSANTDYAVMLGVILAYGNSAKRAAVAEAVNAGDMAALKKVVDGTSVKELFTALKVMARNVDFAAMAETVGVTADVTSAAKLEDIYHTVLCAAGKALEQLDITGMDSKFGNLYNADTGYYELAKADIFRDAELSYSGYTALVELTATELSLNVKLFGEDDCLWGDANHDGKVDNGDAALILKYELGIAPDDFCTKRTDVNGDGKIDNGDAALVLKYELGIITEFSAEKK